MSTIAPVSASPFKGLAPFDDSDEDALLFFGREREREIVIANLMASRLTVLYGVTGVGKSSLLRAGVAHALRGTADAGVVVFSSWPDDVVHSLRHALEVDLGLPSETEGSLADLLAAGARRIGGDVYVILDQFEEYFLYHDEHDSFGDELADVVRRPGLRSNVLIGIREDAVAKLDAFKGRIPGLFGNSLRLDRLERTAGEAAILGPVNAYNSLVESDRRVEIEPGLVAAVLDEVTTGRVELGVVGRGSALAGRSGIEAPYLQLVLERLWRTEAVDGSQRLRLSTLERLGGAQKIVEDHLNHAMAALSPAERDAAAAMYDHLVTPSGMKIAHGVADLARYAAVDESAAAGVLQRLSDQRIVRSGENGGAGRYEIFHDVLADAVLAWRAHHEADRELERAQQAAARRHRVLLRVMVAAIAALALVAAVAIYALIQRSDARHQTAVAQAAEHKAHEQQMRALKFATQARHESARAKAGEKEAKTQKAKAEQQTQKANQQTQKANEQTQKANQSAEQAQAATKRADTSEEKAQHAARAAKTQAANAKREKGVAVHAAKTAKRQRRAARLARNRAVTQKEIARARQIAADARALLVEDPRKSIERALTASAAFRSAGVDPGPEVEDTLRGGLARLRLEAILSGVGVVNVVSFSPDGSSILVAGDRGARLYDRRHGFRSLRLAPRTKVVSAAFSPDGRLVAAGGGALDHSVHVWDVRTGALLSSMDQKGAVFGIEFSPDGKLLATGSADGNARLWIVAGAPPLVGGLPIAIFPHPAGARSGVHQVSFSPDGRRLLTVGGDRFARVYDVATHTQVLKLEATGFLNSARFSHDGTLIATGGNDPLVRIWDASSGHLEYTLRHSGGVIDVAFSPNDALLATAGGIDTIGRVWRLSDRTVTAMFTRHLSGLESVAFTPSGQTVLSRGRDSNLYMWSADGGFERAAFLGHQGPVNDAVLSPDGREVLTASDDGTARLWDARVNVTGPGPPAFTSVVGHHAAAVNTVAFSPDGSRMLSAGDDGTARLWGPGSRVTVLEHRGAVTGAAFSNSGRSVITASKDTTAEIWRVDDGRLVTTLHHGAPLEAARLSPDGRLAVTAGDDGAARLWDVRRGALLHRLLHHGRVNDARFSPDGRRVVTASADGTAAVWRVSDGSRIATLRGRGAAVVTASYAPNGNWIVTADADGTSAIWNPRTGAKEHDLLGHSDAVTAIALSPRSSLVATASLDHDVRVWNLVTGKQVALLRIHSGFVSGVAFSADGRWLATSGPSAVGIWETKRSGPWSDTPLYLVRAADRPTQAVAFSPHGWRIVTGSRDGSVRTFDCRLCGRMPELRRIARARLGRIVTAKP